MTMQAAEQLIREGVAAMQRRDGGAARAAFEQVAAMPGVEPPWLLLAQACRLTGDDRAEGTALDRLLAAQPRNLRALIMKGDLRLRLRDSRAAASCYGLALKSAAAAGTVPPALEAELARAQHTIDRLRGDYAAHVTETLRAAGLDPAAAGPRFGRALDVLLGRAQLYPQAPTTFFYPGLPTIEYFARADFPWLEAIEAETRAIRAELEGVLAAGTGIRPYAENEPGRPPRQGPLAGNPDWSAYHLWQSGAPVPSAAAQCPRTLAALEPAPMPRIRGRSPMALFSLLRPGTHIPPHHGMLNTRLICHLPLIVPDGCALRVGGETRPWEEGRALVFDDSIEHEAWNRSGQLRAVLLFEIWRPELSAEERRALTLLYESIIDYSE